MNQIGNKLFGVDISGLINANIGPGVNDAVLIKVNEGTRTAGNLSAGRSTSETRHPCKGFVDPIRTNQIDGTLVRSTDTNVNLVGDSIAGLAVPQANDRVLILGKEYEIIAVQVDPALALYQCVGRSE